MDVTIEQLEQWMAEAEHEHLEFKEARRRYDFDLLVRYCAALANEGGGRLILGVSDSPPRKVVGSGAFADLQRTKAGLVERLRLRVETREIAHPDGRVVVFEVPPRPLGVPIQYNGAYWMRAGENLVPMTTDQIKRILNESVPDFSAEICPDGSLDDLDSRAIQRFRQLWARKSGNHSLLHANHEQLLTDAELLIDGSPRYAALILLGKHSALGRFLPQAETVFEYRSKHGSTTYQERKEYRKGFLLYDADLWETLNLRNEVQQIREGLFVRDFLTFNQAVVREAILNAISHRDYQMPSSVFVRQFPSELQIVSPGGFPPGITEENILRRQYPRNRRICETLQRCGFVERSGQGMSRMFQESVREGKPRPDFAGTDEYQVAITLRGQIQNPQFLRFLERVGAERLSTFTTEDYLVLDLLSRDEKVPEPLQQRLPFLMEQGVVERFGRGRGVRHILSRRLYGLLGRKGVYTRKRGLDREMNKELLLRHIREAGPEGSRLQEFRQVLPPLSRGQVQALLRELKAEGRIHSKGRTRAARWYPGPEER